MKKTGFLWVLFVFLILFGVSSLITARETQAAAPFSWFWFIVAAVLALLVLRKISKRNRARRALAQAMSTLSEQQKERIDWVAGTPEFKGNEYKIYVNNSIGGELLFVSPSGHFAINTSDTDKVLIKKYDEINKISYDAKENVLTIEIDDFNTPIVKYTTLIDVIAKNQHEELQALLNNFKKNKK